MNEEQTKRIESLLDGFNDSPSMKISKVEYELLQKELKELRAVKERLASVMFSKMTQIRSTTVDWSTDQILAYIWNGSMPGIEE